MSKIALFEKLDDLGYTRVICQDVEPVIVGVFLRAVDVGLNECIFVYKYRNGRGYINAHHQSAEVLAELESLYAKQSDYGIAGVEEGGRLTILAVDVRRSAMRMRGVDSKIQVVSADVYADDVVFDVEIFSKFYKSHIVSKHGLARILAEEIDFPGNVGASNGMVSVIPFVYSAVLCCTEGRYQDALDALEKGRCAYYPGDLAIEWIVKRYEEYEMAARILESSIKSRLQEIRDQITS